jgi:predicted amidohydrolase
MKFIIALLQIAPEGADLNKNLEKGTRYCRNAKARGADLVVFPELWSIGFSPCPVDAPGMQAWEDSAIDEKSQFFQGFVKLARELDLNIAITYLEKHSPKPRNTVAIINGQGEIVLKYSKVFICNFGAGDLQKLDADIHNLDLGCDFNCNPGGHFSVCTLRGKEGQVNVGAMICADREFPEAGTALMLKGAEIIIVPNSCDWDKVRSSLLEGRAFENQLAIVVANYPRPMTNGHSQAYTGAAWKNGEPRPTLLVEAGESEEIVIAKIDVSAIRDFRKEESWRMKYRKNWYNIA